MDIKRIGIIVGAVVLLGIVAAGAYFGAQMLNQPQEVAASGDTGRVMELVTNDGSGPKRLRITFENAPELPDRPPEVGGVLVRQEDNSLIVGSGNINLDIEVNGNTGESQANLSHDGPEIEAIITNETQVYKDVTENPAPGEIPANGEKVVQQKIEPVDSLEETVGKNNIEVQVWGERRGERIIAAVVVFRVVTDF